MHPNVDLGREQRDLVGKAMIARGLRCVHCVTIRMFSMRNKAKDAEIAAEMRSRLMYIELKKDGVRGPARIGRGLKANYVDTQTLEEFWISGPRADGRDTQEKGARRRNMDRRWQPGRFEAKRESTVEAGDSDEHADEL